MSFITKEESLVYLVNFFNDLDYWCLVTTVPIGLVLNTISIVVYSRPNLNKTSMGFYYRTLSSLNILVLLYYFFIMDSSPTMNYDMI